MTGITGITGITGTPVSLVTPVTPVSLVLSSPLVKGRTAIFIFHFLPSTTQKRSIFRDAPFFVWAKWSICPSCRENA